MTNPTVVFRRAREAVAGDRPMPEVRVGQVLVQTRRTLISTGTELTILSGEFPKDGRWADCGKFPFIPGYDNVGTVTDVGEGAATESPVERPPRLAGCFWRTEPERWGW